MSADTSGHGGGRQSPARPAGVLVLIPAAGAARRMRGADKLLEPVEDRPVLALVAARARAAGLPVLVTLPPDDAPHAAARRAALAGLDVDCRTVADAVEGMAASLRAGAAAALAAPAGPPPPGSAGATGAQGGLSGLMVLLPDMPEIDSADIAAMCARFATLPPPVPVLRATAADGRWGHPVILPARCLPDVATLRGDQGARPLLDGTTVLPHPLPGTRAILDLDTPEAWSDWRAAPP